MINIDKRYGNKHKEADKIDIIFIRIMESIGETYIRTKKL